MILSKILEYTPLVQLVFYIVGSITFGWILVQYNRLQDVKKIEQNHHFVSMTERFHNLEKLFMQYGKLSSFYHEIYNKSGYPELPKTTNVDETPKISTMPSNFDYLKKQELEFHVCAIMIQLMEDVWSMHDLSKNFKNPYTTKAGQTKAFKIPKTPIQKPVAVDM